MKKIIYLLAVAMAFSGFSFKPVVKEGKALKLHTAKALGLHLKKKAFTNVNIIATNWSNLTNFQVKFVDDQTHATYIFDIPQVNQPTIGQIPPASYNVYIYNIYGNPYNIYYNFAVKDLGNTAYTGFFASVLIDGDTVVSVDPS